MNQQRLTLIAIFGLLFVVGVLFAVFKFLSFGTEPIRHLPSDAIEPTLYEIPSLGFSFMYREGATGYHFEKFVPTVEREKKIILERIRLILQEDYEAFSKNETSEGPAMIEVGVYHNLNKQGPGVWAQNNPDFSLANFKIGEMKEDVVAGANAVRYFADGLYRTEVVVVAHGGYLFVVSGGFMDEDSQIRKDFESLVQSIKFSEPRVGAQPKINIVEVCNGALAYTTFTSGEAADRWVQECIRGEHPEFIDNYIKSQGLDGAAL